MRYTRADRVTAATVSAEQMSKQIDRQNRQAVARTRPIGAITADQRQQRARRPPQLAA
jgi:hypothetical protein